MVCFVTLLSMVLAGSPLAAAPEGSPTQDAWKGKPRSEIVVVLGAPDKVTTAKDGTETLVYRLFRVDEGTALDPELVLLQVPGVGLVGRRPSGSDPLAGQRTTVEPNLLDKRGHSTGGVTTTESQSVSWSKKDGKTVSPELNRSSKVSRKVKLTFRLDASGEVFDWSVEPKTGEVSG